MSDHDEVILTRIEHIISTQERMEKKQDLTNGRVTALEKWKYMVIGGATITWVIIGFGFQLLLQLIAGK